MTTPRPPKDYPEFLDLVEKLRKAQQEYFRTRSILKLEEAKGLEREVDAEILRYRVQQGGPTL